MLNQEIISFDIGTDNTKIIVGKGTRNNVSVNRAFTFKTPAGTVEDGQILEIKDFKKELFNKLQERKISCKMAAFSIASTKVIMRELVLPYVNDNKMEAMVPYELTKHLPITIEDYIIKFITLEVFSEEKIKKSRILVIALPRFIAKKYWDLCNELELKPVGLSLHATGAMSFFKDKPALYNAEEVVALIDLGHSSINCSIIGKGKLLFNRLLLTEELTESNGQDILQDSFDEKLREGIDKRLEEIKLVFQFYISLQNQNKIDRIILLGGGSKIRNIEKYVEEKLDRPTGILKDNAKIAVKGNGEFPLYQYFNAISALTMN